MGFTMKTMSFYHENHGFGWTSSSRGVVFVQAQGPGSRIALVGHSMGGRIAMQSGPWCLTHFQVKTCYMGCDQKSHIGNLDKHHLSNFWCSVSEYFFGYFWNGLMVFYLYKFNGSVGTSYDHFSGLVLVPRYAADYPEDLNLLVIEDMATRPNGGPVGLAKQQNESNYMGMGQYL